MLQEQPQYTFDFVWPAFENLLSINVISFVITGWQLERVSYDTWTFMTSRKNHLNQTWHINSNAALDHMVSVR